MKESNEAPQSIIINITLWLGVASLLLGIAEIAGISDAFSNKINVSNSGPFLLIASAIFLYIAIKGIKKESQNNNENEEQ